MCIRALDYCPPVDLTFGDYLRALVTADRDMVAEDVLGYRVALIDAFRKRGIFARGVTNLSEESLIWPSGEEFDYDPKWLAGHLRAQSDGLRYAGKRQEIYEQSKEAQRSLHDQLLAKPVPALFQFARLCGLELDPTTAPKEIERRKGMPEFEVHQFRTAFRARPDGTLMNYVTLTLTQREFVPLGPKEGYNFRGGATLILDLDTMTLRYCIRRPIQDPARRTAYTAYMRGDLPASIRMKFFSTDKAQKRGFEPFAFLHGEEWDHA
jgi:hypothetical protein